MGPFPTGHPSPGFLPFNGLEIEVALGDGGLVFEARTLAQGHPLTPLAKRYVDRAVAEQRLSQP
ncbi:MAG: hypothetical protein M3396_06750, partial [Actinomycetota bacterium]|nr:hypothetical protein [Actinomycetota bacterium]